MQEGTMAEDDIYGNKGKYERFLERLPQLAEPVTANLEQRGKRRYYSKNPDNLGYFEVMHRTFEAEDNSYIRRLRVFRESGAESGGAEKRERSQDQQQEH